MKYLGLLGLCYLLCGAHANFFDDLKHVASQIGQQVTHYGGQALQSALDALTKDGVKTLVSAGVSAAATAASAALLGKRDINEAVEAVGILKQDAVKLEDILHRYSADLQTVYNKILLDIGSTDIPALRAKYEKELDSLVQEFEVKMAVLHGKHHKRGLLDGLTSALHSTVDAFKQSFGQVSSNLQGGGTGLLGTLTTAAAGLTAKLSGLKETAAQLLAQGQEGLQSLQSQTGTHVDQAQSGLSGAAHQVVDTLLHPQRR